MRRLLRLLPLVVVMSCAHTPPPSPFAPTPFTAEEIRDATRAGRTYEYKREVAGQPTTLRTMTFVRVDPVSADLTTTVRDEAGQAVGPEETATVTWEELRQHAQFAKPTVTIMEESATTPLGTFECVVYIVKDPSDPEAPMTRFYFAKSMPGAPILYYTEKGGQRVMTSTLVRYSAGG